MAHNRIPRVRVVRRYNPEAAWDEGWLRPTLNWLKSVRARFAPSWSAMLRRWGGVAGMVGGLLWAALHLIFLFHREISYTISPWLGRVLDNIYPMHLILPQLLFALSLVGMYQNIDLKGARLSKYGLRLALIGVLLMLLLPWTPRLWQPDCVVILDGRVYHILNHCWEPPDSIGYLLPNAQYGAILFSLGLVALGISCLHRRIFSAWALVCFIATSIGLQAPLLLQAFDPEIFVVQYLFSLISTSLAHLFGISWIWLGYAFHCKAKRRWFTTQA